MSKKSMLKTSSEPLDDKQQALKKYNETISKKSAQKSSSSPLEYKQILKGYKIEIDSDDDGTIYASIYDEEFVLLGQGQTFDEAFKCLSEQLEMALNDLDHRKYSGNFNVRIPSILHAQLAKVAKLQNKSINELVIEGINEIIFTKQNF